MRINHYNQHSWDYTQIIPFICISIATKERGIYVSFGWLRWCWVVGIVRSMKSAATDRLQIGTEKKDEATICSSESIRKAAKAYSERASNGHHFSELDGLFKAFRAGAVWHGKRVVAYIRECLAPVQRCVDEWDDSGSPYTASYHYDRGKVRGYKDILRDLEDGGLDEYMDKKAAEEEEDEK